MSEAREIFPVQSRNIKDYSPRVSKVSDEEVAEVEEVITPAPKDLSARESVALPELVPETERIGLDGTVQDELPIPNELFLQDADLESGKLSESSEGEVEKQNPTAQPPASSSPASSSQKTKTGSVVPPAPPLPPTSA